MSQIESLTVLVMIQMYLDNKILHVADEHVRPDFRMRTVPLELQYRISTFSREVLFTDPSSPAVLKLPRERSSMILLVFPGIELEHCLLCIDIQIKLCVLIHKGEGLVAKLATQQ